MLSRKLYAFASDLIRLEVLLQQGGVYLDSDIKIIKKPEELFDRPFIASFISMQNRIAKNHIANGFIAATPGHVVTKELYEFFKKKKTASPATDAMKIFYKNGFSSLNNASPNLDFYEFHGIKIYHSDTFYPSFDKEKSEYITTRRTYGIHLSLNEWGDRQQFAQKKLTDYIFRRWDRKILRPIEQAIKKLTGKNKK